MEGLTSFLQIGAFMVAMLTLYKGLSEYGKNNLFKRAEILEKLILKFKDKKLFLAKRVLDDFIVYHYPGISVTKLSEEMVKEVIGPIAFVKPGYPFRYSNAWRLAAPADSDPKLFDIYEDGNRAEKVSLPQNSDFVWVFDKYEKVDSVWLLSLAWLLRNHEEEGIYENEVPFRDSFDELLDFVLLLIYYLRNEIITMREVNAHFQYYLLRIRGNAPLIKYIKMYYNWEDFDWLFRQLPRDIAKTS